MLKILTFVLCLLPFAASANVMTFSGTINPSGPYIEDGIAASPTDFKALGHYNRPGSVYIMDSWGYTQTISFEMDRRFNATSFQYDFVGLKYGYYAPVTYEFTPVYYENLGVFGFRDGVEVASHEFNTGIGFTQYNFDEAFSNLDSLIISVLYPEGYGGPTTGLRCDPIDGDICSYGHLDNVTLSPVPLPAALPLFGAALIGFAALRRFKRP